MHRTALLISVEVFAMCFTQTKQSSATLFAPITIEQAASERWDVIIAGSGFSAMFFLKGLPKQLRVLIVEKGEVISHSDQLKNGRPKNDTFTQENTSNHDKSWVAHTMFGGNSNCWWGQTPRFHPSDFRLFTDHGQAAPWPITYEELESFYVEVEMAMQIAGEGNARLHPRSSPYPFPAHQMGRSETLCRAHDSDNWIPTPTARASGGSRATCCASGVCGLCPVDAKFTILNGIEEFPINQARLLTGVELREIDVLGGVARSVVVRESDGREHNISGDLVALGTNAIYNSAILLRSGVEAPALGRYLHEQASEKVQYDVDAAGMFGGSSITALYYGFYDGEHRSDNAAVMIESFNTSVDIREEKGRWTHRMFLKFIAEDIPQPHNRVALDEGKEPSILWSGHSTYAKRGIERAQSQIEKALPFAIEGVVARSVSRTEAHIQGTHRMGTDPNTSVVDHGLKLHELPNVLALGSGAFPTCAAANPTLTLSALALRAGRLI